MRLPSCHQLPVITGDFNVSPDDQLRKLIEDDCLSLLRRRRLIPQQPGVIQSATHSAHIPCLQLRHNLIAPD